MTIDVDQTEFTVGGFAVPALSSVTVVFNGLRLRRFRPPEIAQPTGTADRDLAARPA